MISAENKSKNSKVPKSTVDNNTTHLYFNNRNLKKIPKFHLSNVYVLYLHNNQISQIENLKSSSLSSLYLQCNLIDKIESLENVRNLKKLYLENNEISVVEGLSHLNNLEELHIAKQRLPMGTSICFDPRSILSIAKSLRILDISNNNLDTLSSITPLRHLCSIKASNNNLNDLDELCEMLKTMFYLRDAWFNGNPISRKHRYREDIIASSYCLENLDDKTISANTRNFIKRFENEKMKKMSKPSINLPDIHTNLPRNYPPPLQKAVSASLIQKQLHILGPLDVAKSPSNEFRPPIPEKSSKKKQHVKSRIHTVSIDRFPGAMSLKKIKPK